jgi:DNA modification methylase
LLYHQVNARIAFAMSRRYLSVYKKPEEPSDGRLPIDSDFPVDFANEIARLESYNKHHYRPNAYLHKWWARRCGSTFRLILKSLVEEAEKRDYYHPGGLEGVVILDPMMGGGTTLHEAIRLGANVIGSDIDPVPILQARATLSELPLERLEEAFTTFYEELHHRLAHNFMTRCPACDKTTELMYTLYGRKQRCSCGQAVLVDAYTLRQERDGFRVAICPDCGQISRHNDGKPASGHSCPGRSLPYSLLEKGIKRCPDCHEPFLELLDDPFYARYEPVAIAGRCPDDGLFFKKPDTADLGLIARANRERSLNQFAPQGDFAIQAGPKSNDLIRHGVSSYLELFSSRQLAYLATAIDLLRGYNGLIKLNLGLLISTSTEFNTMLCGYKGAKRPRPGAIRHAFSHHAYSLPYTALENNPLYPHKRSGTLQALFHARGRRARNWAALPLERKVRDGQVAEIVEIEGERGTGDEVQDQESLSSGRRKFLLRQGSAVRLGLRTDSVDHIVTDPPYFDNVQYSDLSAYFRVWLKRIFAEEADWDYDLSGSAVDPQANGDGQYERVLKGIFAECQRVLKKGSGRLIFTFHHWNPRGWSALTVALKEAGFVLRNNFVIHAENPASVHISNSRALEHDAVLVLAANSDGDVRRWDRPQKIDMESSRVFTGDCAQALGWMLGADLDSSEIERTWVELLG